SFPVATSSLAYLPGSEMPGSILMRRTACCSPARIAALRQRERRTPTASGTAATEPTELPPRNDPYPGKKRPMTFAWLRPLQQRLRRPIARKKPRPSPIRPRVEQLETRVVPSFTIKGSFGIGTSPAAVAVGDFNGNGHLDLVTANQGSN